jgi:large subunit ribosomal protein L44
MSREVLVDCSSDVPARSLSMNHVPKRLVSTAARRASVSSSSSTFPPKESFTVSKDALVKEEFNPETWAALQPPPSTALSAFAHRIGLASILTSTDLIQQVCTHSSFFTLYRHHDPTNSVSKSNAQLSLLGNSLMGLFAAEYIHAKYPYLPTRVLKAAVTAHVGTASCASVAQEMGASQLLRWHRIVCCFLFYDTILISHTPHSLN